MSTKHSPPQRPHDTSLVATKRMWREKAGIPVLATPATGTHCGGGVALPDRRHSHHGMEPLGEGRQEVGEGRALGDGDLQLSCGGAGGGGGSSGWKASVRAGAVLCVPQCRARLRVLSPRAVFDGAPGIMSEAVTSAPAPRSLPLPQDP
ncbi:hypothetical protein O3P69_019923 [Scylla paramamosain]|uniref:Uncharacterized protein n=1 Tax=Scylla paramamosain TaxID=85552 RepID=A0AAW0SJ19_SCYPA